MARMNFKSPKHAEIATKPPKSLAAGTYAGKIISLACRIIGAKSESGPQERVYVRFVADGDTQVHNFELPVFWSSDAAKSKQPKHLSLYYQIVNAIYQDDDDDPTDGMVKVGPNSYGEDGGNPIQLAIGSHLLSPGGDQITLNITQKKGSDWDVEAGKADEFGLVSEIRSIA